MASRPLFVRTTLFVLTLLVATSWPGATRAAVVREPYLQLGTPSTMIVGWRTDATLQPIERNP